MKYYVTPEKVVKNHAKGNKVPEWDAVVMCFHSIDKTMDIVKTLGGKEVGYRLFSKCNIDMVFEASINNLKIGILGWCTGGGPYVASLIEEIKVTGIKWLIGIGAAASIVNELDRSDLVISKEVIMNDGTSRFYSDKRTVTVDEQLYEITTEVAKRYGYKFFSTTGATVEALYRQSEALLSSFRKENVQIVNWELGPFYAVSNALGIRSIWIGHISDVEVKEKWIDWYSNRESAFKKAITICVGVLLELSKVK